MNPKLRDQDDIKYNETLKKKIAKLKKQRNAVIIAHNYQRDEIQEIADISGDSLALSQATGILPSCRSDPPKSCPIIGHDSGTFSRSGKAP